MSALHQVGTGGMALWSLRRLRMVLWERAWLILLCFLLGGGAAYAYLQYAPKSYSATATVVYQAALGRLLAVVNRTEPDRGAQMAEVRRTLASRDLLRRVVEAEQLASNPRFGGAAGSLGELERAVDVLARRISVQVPDEGDVVYITVRAASAELAARVANAVVSELLAAYGRAKSELTAEVVSTLKDMLRKAQDELNTEQTAAPPNETRPPATEHSQRAEELAQQMRAQSDRLAEAEFRRLQLDAQLKQARQHLADNPEGALQVEFLAEQPVVIAARTIVLNRQLELETVAQRYRAKAPAYVAAQEALETAHRDLVQALQDATKLLASEVQSAVQLKSQLQLEYDKLGEQANALVRADTTAVTAPAAGFRELDVVRRFHDRVMERLKDFEFGGDLVMTPLRQTQRAMPPAQPQGPDPVRTFGMGLGGGFLAGLFLALVIGLGNTSLRHVDEVELVLGLPVLSVVPRLKDNESEMAAAEGFRSLRTSIAVSSKGKEPRLLLFTSTSPDEGKTFCALNFAVGLAQQGLKTVLIECDLRRPMAAPSLSQVRVDAAGVSEFLRSGVRRPGESASDGQPPPAGLSFAEIRKKRTEDTKEPGSADPLPPGRGGVGLDDVLQMTGVSNLFFIAAGKPVSNPAELLARPRFEDLLNGLLQRYDKVVLDSAPVLGVSETLLLANRMQGVCFVVRGNQTPRRAIMRAIEMLRRADAPLLGVVLNGVTPKPSDPYGQDYYYHRTGNRR
jgi:polysaccharide biosynthesis transport protein